MTFTPCDAATEPIADMVPSHFSSFTIADAMVSGGIWWLAPAMRFRICITLMPPNTAATATTITIPKMIFFMYLTARRLRPQKLFRLFLGSGTGQE